MIEAKSILDFWFIECSPKMWFKKNDKFDENRKIAWYPSKCWRTFVEVRGPGVDRSLSDPKVLGSNTGGAEVGLHDFHNPQI